MSKIEVDTIDTVTGTTELTIGGTNATDVTLGSGVKITNLLSTGIDDNATSTAITINSSQNVDIAGTLSIDDTLSISDGTTSGFLQTSGSLLQFGTSTSDPLVIYTNNAERMRILSGGTLYVGADGSIIPANATSGTFASVGDTYPLQSTNNNICAIFNRHSSTGVIIEFKYNGSFKGSISTNGTTVAYNTSSDYRLKENIVYNFDATTRLKQLKPARFNFIEDADTTVDGFLAHEVQSVVPEAVTGTHNETQTKEKVVVSSNGQVIAENIEQVNWENGKIADENGNTQYPTDSTWEATKVVPVYQGIDQAKLVPLLVKTIQELEARITALENK